MPRKLVTEKLKSVWGRALLQVEYLSSKKSYSKIVFVLIKLIK